MRAITIQHRSVLEQLNTNGTYRAEIRNAYSSRRAAYEFMANEYGYASCPIFLAPVGQKVEFCGVEFDNNHVAIELDIPDDFVRIQKYYDWSDFMYFLDLPDEFDSSMYANVLEFGHCILLTCDKMDTDEAYQITVEELCKDWIVGYTKYLGKIMRLHNGSCGNNVLHELEFYTK